MAFVDKTLQTAQKGTTGKKEGTGDKAEVDGEKGPGDNKEKQTEEKDQKDQETVSVVTGTSRLVYHPAKQLLKIIIQLKQTSTDPVTKTQVYSCYLDDIVF